MTIHKFDLTEAERHQLLVAWNSTQADSPHVCVHELFEAQVQRTPNAITLVAGSHQLTYWELNQRTNQLAHYLQTLGVKADSLVGIYIERYDPLMIIGILGILKAGGAYVPLDPSYPKERLQFILSNSEAEVLLTNDSLLSMLPQSTHTSHVVNLDHDWEIISGEQDDNTVRIVRPNHLAYVIYTSGSTGQPKGVAMEHRSLTNLLWWHAQTRPASCGLKTLQFCAISFDFSCHEIFSTLCFGGTLVLVTEDVRRDPFALAKFIYDNKIEKLFLPVPALHQLAEAVYSETIATTLREVITTGEKLQITPAMVSLFSRTGAILHNHYGATEFQDATTFTLSGDPTDWPALSPIGSPISNVQIYILDKLAQLVPIGEIGELYIGGTGVARGYLNHPELTKEKFISNPFAAGHLYKTGDLARYQADGTIENLGRTDYQVKIRGIRIELGEIEAVLAKHPAVRESVVMAQGMSHKRLVAYVVVRQEDPSNNLEVLLHSYLSEHLPDYMLPEAFVVINEMPLTPSGKINRQALPAPKKFSRMLESPVSMPQSETQQRLVDILQEALQLDALSIHDNFFDLGATSLLLVQIHQKLVEAFDRPLPNLTLFQYPTIETLAQYLSQQEGKSKPKAQKRSRSEQSDIAIIGMSGRFPGAEDIDTFWQNLCQGTESISFFSDNEAEQNDSSLLNHPNYVNAGAVLPDIECFDASFFDISPKEAATMDPQQRIFLECAWEAFENAGYNPETYAGNVGVYAGSSISTYLLNNVSPNLGYSADRPLIEADMLQFQVKLGNDRNYLSTRVSYKLNLTGPSINVQTACSTALVAVHLACQSILSGESQMALAGGISIIVPDKGGYLYEENMIRSPDGHCRAFDSQAAGTLFGNGGGTVLLKRLDDARADGDQIFAVIKGSATNNDGALKVGFTAPSIERQVVAISEALAVADVDASTVTYVEAHGTGTQLGDPIEIAALSQAFQQSNQEESPQNQYCAVGSVKTNIGHLDEAAGIAGLIKTALALKHKQIPPSLHFNKPNPKIDFENSPFYVNTELSEWTSNGSPRRAGVSSFGMGGTNCHIVLEEALAVPPEKSENDPVSERPLHLLTLSAKNEQALQALVKRYVDYLASPAQHEANLADICFTANTGRKHFNHRFAVVAESNEQLQAQLERFLELGTGRQAIKTPRKIAFLFTGQGSQYVDMGRELYETQALFRKIMTQCDHILQPHLEVSLLELLYGENKDNNNQLLSQTKYTQPALFAIEYALAKLWQSWGIEPTVVMGHSVGEYVAACLAGVFSLADGLKLIAERGRLIQALPQNGVMVAVQAYETKLRPMIEPYRGQVSIAGLNAPLGTVLSGKRAAINEIVEQLLAEGIKCKPLEVSHAFHSPLMEPMLAEFGEFAQKIDYAEPQLKLVSNLSGELHTHFNADYWIQHIQQPVLFAKSMGTLDEMGIDTFIEVGPKPILMGLGQQCLNDQVERLWLPSLYPIQRSDWAQTLENLATLYSQGGQIDWLAFDKPYIRQKLSLPTYPFQRERHWVDRPSTTHRQEQTGHPLLGERLPQLATSQDISFQNQLSPIYPAYLNDHRLYERVVVPAAAYLEMALSASQQIYANEKYVLQNIALLQPLLLSEATDNTVQLILSPISSSYQLQVFGLKANTDEWQLLMSGELSLSSLPDLGDDDSLQILQQRCTEEVALSVYETALTEDLYLGPDFQGISQLFRGEKEALGLISLPENLVANDYQIHPVLLDCCLRVNSIIQADDVEAPYLPVSCEQVRLLTQAPLTSIWSHVKWRGEEAGTRHVDITLFNEETGQVVAELSGLGLRQTSRKAIIGAAVRTDWLYELAWLDTHLPQQSPYQDKPGRWLIVSEQTALVEPLAQLLQRQGADVESSAVYQPINGSCYQGVVYLAGLPERPTTQMPERALDISSHVLDLVKQLLQAETVPDLWLVTDNKIEHSVLWGFFRTLMWEHPQLNSRCVEVNTETTAKGLFETIWYADQENQIRLNEGHQRQVARLEPYQLQPAQKLSIKRQNSYLITEGVDGFGLKVAKWLVEQGATHLVLSRKDDSDAVQSIIADLESTGAQVKVVKTDLSQAKDVEKLLQTSQAFAPLKGIIHTASMQDNGAVAEQTPARFATIFVPKVSGSWYLHQYSQSIPLDLFVCFSSQSSFVGQGSNVNYASANAFMDALMHQRQKMGLPALSINWDNWSEDGLEDDTLSLQQGVELFGTLLNQHVPQVGVSTKKWKKYTSLTEFPVLSKLIKPKLTTTSQSVLQQLSQASASERDAILKNFIKHEIEQIAGIVPADGQSLFELGMDSLMLIQLTNRLNSALQITLSLQTLLSHNTVEQLAQQAEAWQTLQTMPELEDMESEDYEEGLL